MIPSFNRQRWILLFGDVVLILLATQLSTWLRIGRSFNVFEIHTGASTQRTENKEQSAQVEIWPWDFT